MARAQFVRKITTVVIMSVAKAGNAEERRAKDQTCASRTIPQWIADTESAKSETENVSSAQGREEISALVVKIAPFRATKNVEVSIVCRSMALERIDAVHMGIANITSLAKKTFRAER